MLLEACAARYEKRDDVQVTTLELSQVDDVYRSDWSGLIPMLKDTSMSVNERAACFHYSMAQTLLTQAIVQRELTGVNTIGLAGGVFQNCVLTERCIELLSDNGFQVTLPLLVPVNDAGISFGQIIDIGYQRR